VPVQEEAARTVAMGLACRGTVISVAGDSGELPAAGARGGRAVGGGTEKTSSWRRKKHQGTLDLDPTADVCRPKKVKKTGYSRYHILQAAP
jgi:hypothetical protein